MEGGTRKMPEIFGKNLLGWTTKTDHENTWVEKWRWYVQSGCIRVIHAFAAHSSLNKDGELLSLYCGSFQKNLSLAYKFLPQICYVYASTWFWNDSAKKLCNMCFTSTYANLNIVRQYDK